MREPRAWTLAGTVVRWLVTRPLGPRCGARGCPLIVVPRHRFCHLHEDVLLAHVGSGSTRSDAEIRLLGLAAGVRGRLEAWAAWKLADGLTVDLTAPGPGEAAWTA